MSTLRVLDKDGNWVDIPTIVGPVGPVGPTGETGPGVPSGGSTGQILKKKSEDDFDTEWITPTDMDLYYTKEEADDLINSKISTTFKYKGTKANYAAIQAVTNPAVGDVWNDASTDHNYVWNGSTWDKLAGTVDMTNYYTKDEAEDMVDNKINNIPVNDLLHYKGHVNSLEDLPTLGQPSGNATSSNLTLSSSSAYNNADPTYGLNDNHPKNLKNYINATYNYYIGGTSIYTSSGSTYYTAIVSDYYDVIDGIALERSTNGYCYLLVHMKYDANKPVFIKTNARNSFIPDSTGNFGTTDNIKTGSFVQVTESGWVPIGNGSYASTGGYAHYLCSNMPFIKYKPFTGSNVFYCGNGPTVIKYTSVTNKFVYTYTEGMQMFKFVNEKAQWVDSNPQASKNDMYTVGSMRELYRCNEEPAWEKLSDFKEFQVTEMGEDDYLELPDKNTFDMYILDRVVEITDTTNLLINSITGDVDLVEANISEEEALAITDEIIGGVSDE